MHVSQAIRVAASWADSLVVAQGRPLMLAGERAGRRIVVHNFDLRRLDLPSQIAFPILMANIIGWLGPEDMLEWSHFTPGDIVPILPGAGTVRFSVLQPEGERFSFKYEGGPIQYDATGINRHYQLVMSNENCSRNHESFVVNPFVESEQDIRPATGVVGGWAVIDTLTEQTSKPVEGWPWFADSALLLLLLEWWAHHRGALRAGVEIAWKSWDRS